MTENEISIKIKEFLKETYDGINKIDMGVSSFYSAVEAISKCKGKVITTGLGKAGYAARKASSSFCSLGVSSVYLHPAEASHGDSGVLHIEDIIVAFSTSGKTREVIETLMFARGKVACVIAITSHKDAVVKRLADIVLDMGEVSEAGYLHMAPTTSIIIMLIISDMLATVCAEAKGFTIENFAKCHHGGYLGAKARGEVLSSSSSQ